MPAEIGWAGLGIVPEVDGGFYRKLGRDLNPGLMRAGRNTGRRFGSVFGASFSTIAGFGFAAAAGKIIRDSVSLEAEFSTTMRKMGVATGAPAAELGELRELAEQLGADTVFSANEAAGAMLELAKNGITPAVIEAGALKSALTLAAAGDLPLERAATVMGNALNAFGLKGGKARSVAAALAGAANASSASVDSLAQGLQQAAAGADDAGLTVQETTAALAAFANGGIDGSDAGTSLKNMLARLVPQTDKAANMMADLGLNFTDANGEFLSLTDIAGQLHSKLGDLSAEERTTALQVIFGNDARRAAKVLMDEGRDGIEKYVRATSDQQQAEKMAKASMEGTAGAMERLSGAWETAQTQLGKGLAPLVEDLADGLAGMLDSGDFEKWGSDIASGLQNIVEDYTPLARELKDLGEELLPAIGDVAGIARDALEAAAPLAADLVGAFNDMPDEAKAFLLAAAGGAVGAKKLGLFSGLGGGGKSGLLGLVSKSKPIPVLVVNKGFGTGDGLDVVGGGSGTSKGGKVAKVAKGVGKAVLPASLFLAGRELGGDEFGRGANDAGVGFLGGGSLKELKDRADAHAEVMADSFRRVYDDAKQAFDEADLPSQLKTEIALQGVPEAKSDVRALVREYNLTPKQKETLFDLVGYDRIIERLRRINAELDWTARPREARIEITKIHAAEGRDTKGGLFEGAGTPGSARRRQIGGF